MLGTYTLSPGPSGTTKVEYTLETVTRLLSDQLLEAIGGRGWTKRQATKAMRRLRTILEEGRDRGRRTDGRRRLRCGGWICGEGRRINFPRREHASSVLQPESVCAPSGASD